MGTWSITPNTLASIDNNGKATFQEHTSQVVYTIKYTSDTCGTVTKQVTVYPCTQECTCSTTGGLTVPAEASETEVQVGTYSSSNCGGSWSTPTLRSGTDFLKDFRFADGKIYAKVKSTNTDADARSVQYNTGIGTCTDYFTVNQSGTGTCDCTSSRFSVTGVTVDASGGETILIGNFTSECMPLMSFENYAGDTFIDYSKVSTNYDSLTKKGQIYAKVSQNTASSERMEQPGVLIDGETDFCKHFAVTQTKGICTPELAVSAAENCCVNFKVVQPCTDIQEYDIIEWGYSETNTPIFTNGQAFSSKSATGATGIDQCPSITSDGNWYIFWRNKTAHSVSGSQYVTLAGCAPATCTCQEANVQVGTTAITLGNAAYSTANTTYTHDCIVYINNNEAKGWLDVNSTNGKLEFNSITQATSTRSANVYIDDINGEHCKTIKVTQERCGDTLNISYGILFENQPVAVDSLSAGAVYSVGGAEVNYTKCDGSKGHFKISAAYGSTTDAFVNFHKGDFDSNGTEARKTTSYTVSDLVSIDSITLPNYISVGQGVNIWGTAEEHWGGDFRNDSEKTPGTTYAYECYATCPSGSYINARNTYSFDGNNLTIYLSFEDIVL